MRWRMSAFGGKADIRAVRGTEEWDRENVQGEIYGAASVQSA